MPAGKREGRLHTALKVLTIALSAAALFGPCHLPARSEALIDLDSLFATHSSHQFPTSRLAVRFIMRLQDVAWL